MAKSAKKQAPAPAAAPKAKKAAKKAPKKAVAKKADIGKAEIRKADIKKAGPKRADIKKAAPKKKAARRLAALAAPATLPAPPLAVGASPAVLDRLWAVVNERRNADPAISHSARLLSRGTAKVAQKFGEEAVECLIEAVGGNRDALVAESADVLYHLIVMWVNAGVRTEEVWAELQRREGVSGVAEKASRARALPLELGLGTTKIP
jgi:phosphoribosyl-ATP pyrophosphohydrolase